MVIQVPKKFLLILVLAFLIVCIPFIIGFLIRPHVDFELKSINYDPDLNDATKWVVTKWNAHQSSWGKIEGSRFKLYFKPVKLDEWGNVAVTQGNQAHCPIKNPIPLKEKFIIRREGNDVCFVKFKAMRHEFTFLKSPGICEIGITLYLDVGLDFCSPDITQPHALPIDFIFAKFEDGKIVPYGEVHWQSNPYENDYHSAFIIGQMPNPDIDYSFEVRIDDLIRKSLRYWSFDKAEVKGVHAWLDGINSEGSCEIDYVEVKVNEKIYQASVSPHECQVQYQLQLNSVLEHNVSRVL